MLSKIYEGQSINSDNGPISQEILPESEIFVTQTADIGVAFYAPNFEEVDGAYWFRVVRPSVCSSKPVHARVLKFHIWISHGKIVDTRFFFLVRVISLSGVLPL